MHGLKILFLTLNSANTVSTLYSTDLKVNHCYIVTMRVYVKTHFQDCLKILATKHKFPIFCNFSENHKIYFIDNLTVIIEPDNHFMKLFPQTYILIFWYIHEIYRLQKRASDGI